MRWHWRRLSLDLRDHITVICWSGVRGKINRTAQLRGIVQHYLVAQFLEQFNRSVECILSHWARFTAEVHFCACVLCLLYVVLLSHGEVDLVGLKPDP